MTYREQLHSRPNSHDTEIMSRNFIRDLCETRTTAHHHYDGDKLKRKRHTNERITAKTGATVTIAYNPDTAHDAILIPPTSFVLIS